ncbi:MAG TPA: hypothetical protein VJ937_12630 [Salinivirga sp.]|uniref:hypothetical protein n=1 Tax=Salinivirga sp. TaxID=1970192 RepID=UPI002B47989D|nr:hypothetical protein [Salinivirga sp.]HKK60317.1 hypothetical protein [Salinivirga sp.]
MHPLPGLGVGHVMVSNPFIFKPKTAPIVAFKNDDLAMGFFTDEVFEHYYLIPDSGLLIPGLLIPGFGLLIPGFLFRVPGFLIPGFRFLIPGSGFVDSRRCPELIEGFGDSRFQVFNSRLRVF